MPLPVISNVYRTALEWSALPGGTPVNVLHFRGTPGSAAGLYTALDANVTNAMWIMVTANIRVTEVVITPLDGSTASTINSPSLATKWQGGTSGDYIPGAAAVLSLRTAKRGPSYRGRIFFPALPESENSGGVLLPADVTTCINAWVTFRTAMAAAGYTLVVASYKLATAETVTSTAMNATYGMQRRRQNLS